MTTGSDDQELATTPQDYGFPVHYTESNLRVWQRQEAFLSAFARSGKIGKAAKAVGISRACVEKWQGLDVYGFKKRMREAHADYVELLEEDFDDFVHESKHNTQIARIFRLRAEAPEKYREEVKVLGVSAPLQMLDRLRELAARELKAREALEAPAVEAEFREMPDIQVADGGRASPKRGHVARESGYPKNPGPESGRPDHPGAESPVSKRSETSDRRLSSPEPARKSKREPGRFKRR